MQKMKNEKGVTISVLAVVMIVLMILGGVSIYLGTDSVDETRNRRLQSELEMVQQVAITEYVKAKQLGYTKSNDMPLNYVGTKIQIMSLPKGIDWLLETEPTELYKAYYEVKPEDLSKLDILNAEYTYIVNYYTGEVYNNTVKKTSTNQHLYIRSLENVDTSAVTDLHIEREEDTVSFNDW